MRLTKVCSKCEKNLPLSYFRTIGKGRKHKRSECKVCERLSTKDTKKIKKIAPPIPINHICPICLKGEDEVRGLGGELSGPWCCDHDHKSKTFRGYLCHKCNRLLGGFEEDISKLDRAKEYLISNREKTWSISQEISTIFDYIEDNKT